MITIPSLVFLGLVSSLPVWTETASDPLPDPVPALQNRLLRSYFLEHRCTFRNNLIGIQSRRLQSRDSFRSRIQNRCVDAHIRALVADADKDLRALDEAWDEVREHWRSLPRQAGTGVSESDLKARFHQLEKRAGDLRKRLKFLEPLLKVEKENRREKAPLYFPVQDPLHWINSEIQLVGSTIRDFLFTPNPAVDVQMLTEGNMLVRLNRIEKVSHRLAETPNYRKRPDG